MVRDEDYLGISVEERALPEEDADFSGFFIRGFHPRGCVVNDGRLLKDDRLLQVNGYPLNGL